MDLAWKAKAEQPRFGNGAFLVCLEALYRKFTGKELEYSKLIGKPSQFTYEFALERIQELYPGRAMETVYGIGDNLKSDIQGLNQAKDMLDSRYGSCGKSVLVKTGVDKAPAKSGLGYEHAHRDFVGGDCMPDVIHEDLYEFIVDSVVKSEEDCGENETSQDSGA